MSSILSKNQINILSLLSKDKLVVESFYLTGGTALAEFYLQHRLSEDLDFFSEKEFDPAFISSIKTEFTYFPFERIESKKKFGDLYIDSLLDIAVNKLFTIYQKPRSRDFIDLYFILQQEKTWTVNDLAKNAQIKFGTYVNPLQLSSQFIKAEILKDYPNMIKNIDDKEWQEFFMKEAKSLAESKLE
ncbi:MAG: nucleotidyl transferase AbiEii/AbiGii toxin family protein [bacterium]|nr:nucleotidyl transferase AbiEii/AbiGii toxin family protein [bacterium]